MHKPLSNRLLEGKKIIEMARNSKVITHLIPWDSNGSMETVMAWINGGAIGTLTEVHNWTKQTRMAAICRHTHRYAARSKRL
jgi:hypothetical protein